MPRMTKMIKDISEDTLYSLINAFLNEHSDQIIEDWDLVTKKDFNGLEERFYELEKHFNLVSLNFDALEKRFSEYRGDTNTKLENFKKTLENNEKRLEKLETKK